MRLRLFAGVAIALISWCTEFPVAVAQDVHTQDARVIDTGALQTASLASDADADRENAALIRAREAIDRNDLSDADAILAPLRAVSSPRRSAVALFLSGNVHELRREFAPALTVYRASVARDPSSRYASRALARIDALAAEDEGSFAPLAVLERIRSDPALASNPGEIAALARAARSFPPGRVRADARLVVAQAYVGRLHRPADALPILHELALDRSAPAGVRQLASELLVQAGLATRRLAETLPDLRALGADPLTLARVRRLLRRDQLRPVAWIAVAAVLLLGLASAIRAARSGRARAILRGWFRPLPLAHLAMLCLGGAVLAHSHDDHDVRPFLALGAGALAVYLAAVAIAVVGSKHAVFRTLCGVACFAGVLAVSFLAMDRFDPGMLEGIGL